MVVGHIDPDQQTAGGPSLWTQALGTATSQLRFHLVLVTSRELHDQPSLPPSLPDDPARVGTLDVEVTLQQSVAHSPSLWPLSVTIVSLLVTILSLSSFNLHSLESCPH